MKKMLCAIDYSKNSTTALKYAYSINKKMNTHLVVVHVFGYPTALGTDIHDHFPNLDKDTFKQQYSKLKAFCYNQLGEDLNKMNISLDVIENLSVVNGIVNKADQMKAFMIVLGMKGQSAIKDLLIGNTTRNLIDKANCLVLAIPERAYFNEIKTIVYASDFEADKDIEVIKKITGFANAFDAKIEVVHIADKKEFDSEIKMELFKNKLKEKINYKNIGFNILHSKNIFETLRVYLGDVNADVVVMLEREDKGLFKSLFYKDLVKKMEIYGNIPMISFNENNFGLFHFLKIS